MSDRPSASRASLGYEHPNDLQRLRSIFLLLARSGLICERKERGRGRDIPVDRDGVPVSFRNGIHLHTLPFRARMRDEVPCQKSPSSHGLYLEVH